LKSAELKENNMSPTDMPRSMQRYIEEKHAFDLFKFQIKMDDEIKEIIADEARIIPIVLVNVEKTSLPWFSFRQSGNQPRTQHTNL